VLVTRTKEGFLANLFRINTYEGKVP